MASTTTTGAGAAAGLLFQDLFTDTANTTLASHTPILGQKWTSYGSAVAKIAAGGRGQFTAGQELSNNGYYNDMGVSDYQIFADITNTQSSNWPFIAVRLNPADQTGFYVFPGGNSTPGSVALSECSGGTSFTVRGTWASPYSNGTTQYRVTAIGSTINVYANGTLLGGYASATRNQTLTKFSVGAWNQASNPSIFFDNVVGLRSQATYIFSSLTAAQQQKGVYVFPTFLGDGASTEVLRFIGSWDGIHWVMLPAAYTPGFGTCRDTDYYFDGTTHWIAHINQGVSGGVAQPSHSFEVAKSTDGINWTTVVQQVDCSAITGNTANSFTWSPRWYQDTSAPEGVRIILSLSSTGDVDNAFALYEVHPTAADFTTWSAPSAGTKVTGTSLCTNMIDNDGHLIGTTEYIFYKNENSGQKVIEVMSASGASSSNVPLSGYTVLHSGNWAGWGSGVEGPALVQIPGRNDRMYMDQYQAALGVSYSDQTAGDWKTGTGTWSAVTQLDVPFSFVPRHGWINYIG